MGTDDGPRRRDAAIELCRAARPVDRRTSARRQGGGAGDQETQARTGALLLRRPARRAARQDRGGRRRAGPDASRRHHDDDAAWPRTPRTRPLFRCSRPAAASTWRKCRAPAISSWSPTRRRSSVLPWAPNTGWFLCDMFFPNGKPVPFSTRQILRDALARLEDRRVRLPRRPGSRIPSVQAGESAAHAGGRHLAAAGARSEPAQPGLPVSHREPLRSDRRGAGADPPRHRRARHAAALGGSRARARASANSPSARRRASTPPTP